MSDETDEMRDNGTDTQARISIPGDAVKTALGRLVQTGRLDADGETLVWWFYCHARESHWRLADAAEAIGKDKTTVHRLFNGSYGASYDNLLEAILRYRKIALERGKRRNIGFVETSTYARVSAVCRSALYDSMPAFIYGASQIGKSKSLEEYARRNNHGQTKYIRMPAPTSFPFFLKMVAEACFISTRLNADATRRRIMDAIDDRTLVIVDELHECFITASDLTARKVVEFLREIYDRTGCGMVICGTKVIQDEFERGRQKMVFDQFRRRGMLELVLPDTPPKSDIVKIAAAFDLPAPDAKVFDTIKLMLQESGIGKYFKFLQYAHGISVNRKEKMSWNHFCQAYDGVKSLSSKKGNSNEH
jgi:DNA transposition AAA+ family ATPase